MIVTRTSIINITTGSRSSERDHWGAHEDTSVAAFSQRVPNVKMPHIIPGHYFSRKVMYRPVVSLKEAYS